MCNPSPKGGRVFVCSYATKYRSSFARKREIDSAEFSGFNHSVIVNTIYQANVLRELKIIFVPMNKIYYYQFNKQV